jgi:hypothetical protein
LCCSLLATYFLVRGIPEKINVEIHKYGSMEIFIEAFIAEINVEVNTIWSI